MQITLNPPGQRDDAAEFVLMYVGQTYRENGNGGEEFTVAPDAQCTLCFQRQPVWFAYPATPAAMNPDASPINAPAVCAPCLNTLIEEGQVEVSQLDPDSF